MTTLRLIPQCNSSISVSTALTLSAHPFTRPLLRLSLPRGARRSGGVRDRLPARLVYPIDPSPTSAAHTQGFEEAGDQRCTFAPAKGRAAILIGKIPNLSGPAIAPGGACEAVLCCEAVYLELGGGFEGDPKPMAVSWAMWLPSSVRWRCGGVVVRPEVVESGGGVAAKR
jgi:hypothetical protein